MRKLDPVKHEEKREEILGAAWRCLSRDGFAGASTADICKEAGISPGHLYHYFDSKEAIVTALTATGLERAETRFHEMMQGSNALTAMISELDKHKKSRDQKHKIFNQFVLELLVESGRNPPLAKIVRANSRRLKGLLSEFLKSGQSRGQIDPKLDPEVAAGMLLGVMDGMKTLGLRDPKADMAASIEQLQLLISRYLSPPASH